METKKRNFSYLQKNMTLEQFDEFCKKIANQYAKSEAHFSGSYFSEQENITKGCFYKLLETAIVKNLIDEDTVNKMETKAIANQKLHADTAGETTVKHYETLKKKRNEYIIFSYSDEEINEIAKEFATHAEMSKTDFAKKNVVSVKVIDVLLKKAFTEGIADDETCKAIEKRSLSKNSSKAAKSFFEQLWKRRNCKENALN